ncbi:type IVB secretion system protein IcmH/DotU [Sphingomonas radiodurans]|uniref:type IVB secretion system protein IcmH/DotU n=1 Tax=Sphingomonas radiodurans TaxID=2890321 RepID=UPI001E2CAB22|nr:type IVB secretion system protein IcmH/DotU [Sphingomonas radiodurans]WBH16690.1 type IVB secretion system protein IcmH/DotU [Sphingomonas radiodurans]
MSGGSDDADKTVFMPAGRQPGALPPVPGFGQQQQPPPSPPAAPGGYVPPQPQPIGTRPAPPPPPGVGAPVRIDFAAAEPDLYGPEPLVAAAGRLIHLASQIRTMPIGPDLGALRRLVTQELEAFSGRARTLGLEQKSVQLAHYILCAFVDDAVMSTPWGANSQWSRQSLLAAYHNDTQGGDRMFQFAERMEQDPKREPRLMELLYQCLALGFEGRAALDPRGESLLHQRRARLAQAITNQRGAQPGDLSPQWRGQTVASGRYSPRVPLWAILAGLAAVGLLIFAALLFRLSSSADTALAGLNRAVGGAEIVAAPPPAAQSQTPTFDRMREILKPDIDAGRLDVVREANEIVVRLHNQGLFGSAQADASSGWSDTFGRIAEAANLTKGPIRVEGHTDDQAIRSLTFPSNQELSVARAQSVAEAVDAAGLSDTGRLSTAGFGANRPIGDNKTEDGRRENRRVELRVANDIAWR